MSSNDYLIPDWDAPANVYAAMTLRTGGVSQGSYASLNPAAHVEDQEAAVLENRRRIKIDLKLPSEPFWLQQVHSANVVEIGPYTNPSGFQDLTGLITADASFTRDSQTVCAVLTADCLPLLFCSADGEKIAAVHAGWRGLAGGIITNAVRALQTDELKVWLGAAIGPCCFEIGAEVCEAFVSKNPDFAAAFNEAGSGKYMADIYQLARTELASRGIHQVYGGGLCTVCDAQRFYSYRRDTRTGRMASLIWKD